MDIYHPVSDKIRGMLEKERIWFETFEHAPVRTSEEAARMRPGYSLHEGAKAIIIRVKIEDGGKKFAMLVFPADLRFDINKVRKLFMAYDIRFATEKEISELTEGIEPGGIPPFGSLFGIELIADPKLFLSEKMVFNAGDRGFR
ncbi:MAG: hypothetical protein HYX24_01320 [Candidatus Aenigmarchaeota archaeon]|nr:hypothetical protein [Candidatus Aenigmarchaeota archaeon]